MDNIYHLMDAGSVEGIERELRKNIPISICILSYNRLERLKQCLNQLLPLLIEGDELILYDNASTDGTWKYMNEILYDKKRLFEVTVIKNSKNIGLSAVEECFQRMTNFYRMKIDDDIIEIPNDFREKLIEVFEKISNAGYITVALKNDHTLPQAFFDEYNNESVYKRETINGIPMRIGNASGGFVMTTQRVWEQLHFAQMINEGINYFNEDFDYSERCRGNGFLVGFRSDIEVFHAFGAFWNKEFSDSYFDKYANWIYQPGIRNRSDEEKKQLLRNFSVKEEDLDKILKVFKETYAKSN